MLDVCIDFIRANVLDLPACKVFLLPAQQRPVHDGGVVLICSVCSLSHASAQAEKILRYLVLLPGRLL